MRVFGAVLLFLLAALTGGCSLLFTFGLYSSGGSPDGAMLIWFIGIVISVLSFWRGRVLLRRRPDQPDRTADATTPPGPKSHHQPPPDTAPPPDAPTTKTDKAP